MIEGYRLSTLLEEAFEPRTDQAQQAVERAVRPLAEQALCHAHLVGQDVTKSIGAMITTLDRLLSDQINLIMHHEKFRQLESTWRGLYFLVSRTETSPVLKPRVLDVSKRELSRDLERAVEFDQSAIFQKVYEEEYGTFGGRAFGLLIGDYAFGREADDLYLLELISHVAAAAHAPYIAAAKPTLFGLESFADLSQPRDLAQVFTRVEYAKWRLFRDSEDSKYVGLVLPRILLRLPYGDSNPVDAFNFCEQVESHDDWLWGNPAYALGSCITTAFAKYHWCAAIRGVEGGGLVEGLPVGTFPIASLSDEGGSALKCPTELGISDRQEKELADLGFIPLLHAKGTDYAIFFSMQTCCQPKQYDLEAANANARSSTQLQYVLTTSRFAHYLKSIIRDHLGTLTTRAECEQLLNRWIQQYVSASDIAVAEHKARFPLREARVDVTEMPGKPGIYRAVVFLRPHFQLDELSISMRLVVELPAAAKS
jgi:type VI secretion system protein ImpC